MIQELYSLEGHSFPGPQNLSLFADGGGHKHGAREWGCLDLTSPPHSPDGQEARL